MLQQKAEKTEDSFFNTFSPLISSHVQNDLREQGYVINRNIQQRLEVTWFSGKTSATRALVESVPEEFFLLTTIYMLIMI